MSWFGARRDLTRFAPDAVIVPAWTFFVAPCLGWISWRLRRYGIPVVSVVHNVSDHEEAGWKMRLSLFQLRQAQVFVTHNSSLASALRARLAGVVANPRILVHPHPFFEQYPEPRIALPRRAGLELLFFGLVRPYKGLDVALRAIARCHRTDLRLSAVGEFWEGREETEALIHELGIADRVELVPRYVTDAEAAQYFARADVVVLPYRSVTASGVVPVAYRYGKPVVVSDLPGLIDVVRPGETGWVVSPDDPDALARLLDEEIRPEALSVMAPHIAAIRFRMSWSGFADLIVDWLSTRDPSEAKRSTCHASLRTGC